MEALRQVAGNLGPLALGMGFLAGLAFSFNPVALAAIPVSLAYITRSRSANDAIQLGAMFGTGMILAHVVIGFGAGLGGRSIELIIGTWWGLAVGPVLIVLGLLWPGWLHLPMPPIALRAKQPAGPLGAMLFGAVFSIAVCPVCTPALIVLIGVAAASASPVLGALLLLAFALGRLVPVAAGAWAVGWIRQRPVFAVYRRSFEIAGGAFLVASGLYMLNLYFSWLPMLAS